VDGNPIRKADLLGKVTVINYWFVGCPPCEVERPALNELVKKYAGRNDVIFISFARNSKEELLPFLRDSPLLCAVVPTEKDFIKKHLGGNGFPSNIIVGKDGKYFYNSLASGIGIANILEQQIEKALRQ